MHFNRLTTIRYSLQGPLLWFCSTRDVATQWLLCCKSIERQHFKAQQNIAACIQADIMRNRKYLFQMLSN